MEYRNKHRRQKISNFKDMTKLISNEECFRQTDFVIAFKKELTCYQAKNGITCESQCRIASDCLTKFVQKTIDTFMVGNQLIKGRKRGY